MSKVIEFKGGAKIHVGRKAGKTAALKAFDEIKNPHDGALRWDPYLQRMMVYDGVAWLPVQGTPSGSGYQHVDPDSLVLSHMGDRIVQRFYDGWPSDVEWIEWFALDEVWNGEADEHNCRECGIDV